MTHCRKPIVIIVSSIIWTLTVVPVFSAPAPVIPKVDSKIESSSQTVPGSASGTLPADGLPSDSTLAAPLPQPLCTLEIKSDPDGAAVYLDDSLKGKTPFLAIDVPPGNHVLTLKKKGCFLKKSDITVDSAGLTALSFVLLQPGYLKIETEPSGAEVWIDDKKEGIAPYETDRIKPGDHSIKVLLNRYAPLERSVTISNGGRDSVKLAMDYTVAYKEELAATKAIQDRARKERIYLGIVSAVFVIGAAVMVFMEAVGN